VEIKDEQGFVATLTDPAQKAWYEKAIKDAGTAAVDKFKTDDAAARKAKVPAEYKFKLAQDSQLSNEDTAAFAEYAKNRGYSAEEAQQMLDLVQTRYGALTARQQELVRREIAGWKDQVKGHKTLGGEHFTKTEANIKRALDKLAPTADNAFRKLLNETGYGDHPAVVQFVNDVGQLMSEGGTLLTGGSGTETKELSFTEALYGQKSA
jgi:hypothetical protein